MRGTLTTKALISSGIAILSADIGCAVSGYPWLVTSHPAVLWIVGGTAGIFIVFGLLLPGEREQDAPQPVILNNSQQKMGDVAGGKATANGGSTSVTGNRLTVNFNSVPGFPPTEAAQISSETHRVTGRNTVPKLEVKFVETELLQDNGVFRFSRTGYRPSTGASLCIMVFNAPAEQGEYAADAPKVFAVVRFTSSTGRTTYVDRAYWIQQEDNEVAILIGKTAHILIGFPEGDEWVAFHNPNEPEAKRKSNFRAAAEYVRDLREPEKRPFDWYDGASFDVDVRIVSSSSGQTLAHRQFVLTHNGYKFSAKWKERNQAPAEPKL